MMDDIEQKALDLINTVLVERGGEKSLHIFRKTLASNEALCRAIERHEAFRKEVSDAVEQAQNGDYDVHPILWRFIITKPDPLVEILDKATDNSVTLQELADRIRAALEARGLEIREKG